MGTPASRSPNEGVGSGDGRVVDGADRSGQVGAISSDLLLPPPISEPLSLLRSRSGLCAHCPVAEGLSCPGESARRLCMLVDPGHTDYTPRYIGVLKDLARPREIDENPAAKRPDIAETLSLLGAMRACPFRGIADACGCSGARCGLRNGTFVSHPECFDCLRRYGSQP
jgi:hypothetical protein